MSVCIIIITELFFHVLRTNSFYFDHGLFLEPVLSVIMHFLKSFFQYSKNHIGSIKIKTVNNKTFIMLICCLNYIHLDRFSTS